MSNVRSGVSSRIDKHQCSLAVGDHHSVAINRVEARTMDDPSEPKAPDPEADELNVVFGNSVVARAKAKQRTILNRSKQKVADIEQRIAKVAPYPASD